MDIVKILSDYHALENMLHSRILKMLESGSYFKGTHIDPEYTGFDTIEIKDGVMYLKYYSAYDGEYITHYVPLEVMEMSESAFEIFLNRGSDDP